MTMDKQRLFQQLRLHEGVEKFPYQCTAGYLTIGVGRNIEERGLSDDEIDFILDNDIKIVMNEVSDTFDWFFDITEIRQRVVADMIFNMGLPRFKQFKKMIAALEDGAWSEAADQMLDSKWADQTGARADRLSLMMRDDEDSSDF